MTQTSTYEMVGIKEDVSDIISMITPTKTPFQTAIGKERSTQTLFEWMQEELRAVQSNPVAEGADAVDSTVGQPTMNQNRTQIFMDSFKITGTADATKAYGRNKESARAMYRCSAQLKRDLENALVGTAQTAVAGDDTTPTARKMAGFQAQVDASGIVYCGAAANLDETHLVTALQAAYTNGADPTRIAVTPSNSVLVAAFAAAAGRYRTLQTGGNDKSIVNVVNLYVSPFGEQKVELNRFLKAHNTLIYDPAMWSLVTLRPWTREDLAKTGDAKRQMVVGEFSSKHKNTKASAIVVDNATTGF